MMTGNARILPIFVILACLVSCRYQPVWETTPGPTPLPTETPTPAPTATATSIIPTPVNPQSACLPLNEAMQGRWTEVRNTRYHYSFEIPVSWAVDDSQGDNFWVVVSDSRLDSAETGARSECGWLRLYVAVDPVENWVGWVPDPGYLPVQVDGRDGWRRDTGSADATPSGTQSSQISVPAGDYYYLITFQYTPSGDNLGQSQAPAGGSLFTTAVDTVMASFKINNRY